MISIINYKKYDTKTAKLLAKIIYDEDDPDFSFSKALYLKKTGEYFLYNEIGMLTNNGCGPSITPFTEDDAKQWVMKHCSGEKYIKLFGDVEE